MHDEQPRRQGGTPSHALSDLLEPEEFAEHGEAFEDAYESEAYDDDRKQEHEGEQEHEEAEEEGESLSDAAHEVEDEAAEFLPEAEGFNESESAGWEAEAVDRELDPDVLDLAEQAMAREDFLFEGEALPAWTRCFTATDAAKVAKVYQDNATAAGSNSVDRCSCIVMLNVALGQLLPLRLKQGRARGTSNRRVQMADLTNETIEKAMAILQRRGFATPPILINFFDRRNRTAGTLKPERLKASVRNQVLRLSRTKGCWFAFGLSLMDGYHSVLLLVDRTGPNARIFWLDQFSSGLTDDVSSSLDQRITDKTRAFWQGVMDAKKKGYNTTVRLWQLKKPRAKP